jgi:uncharacterized membrane protein
VECVGAAIAPFGQNTMRTKSLLRLARGWSFHLNYRYFRVFGYKLLRGFYRCLYVRVGIGWGFRLWRYAALFVESVPLFGGRAVPANRMTSNALRSNK